MGTQYSWAEVREQAAEAFGGRYPNAELEAELLEEFRERPAFVIDKVRDVTNGFAAGRIKSPWPFLRKCVGEASPDVVVSDSSDRDRAVVSAERWLRTAGLHFDREAEVVDELFGDVGRLRAWSGDTASRARLLAVWQEVRPAGERCEQEANERLARQVEALERAKVTVGRTRIFRGYVKPDGGTPHPENGAEPLSSAEADWVGEEPPVRTALA